MLTGVLFAIGLMLVPISGFMTRWKYMVVGHTKNKKLEEQLNKMGQEGWEVVAGGVGSWPHSQFVLKKPF